MQNSLPLMSAKNLVVRLGDRLVLDSVNLEIERGAPFAIVGESGSGKTTLLSSLCGLRLPDQGSITYGLRPLNEMPSAERASHFGLVFQDYQLFPHLTALDNLLLAPRLRRMPITESTATQLLEELGVGSLHNRFPHQLSGGQKQRIAIARSLILAPSILFLDEPSAALDEKTTHELAALLARLNEKSQIVAVSHDRSFLDHVAGRGIRLEQGKIVAAGSLKVLFP